MQSQTLNILSDKNIPLIEDACKELGNIVLYDSSDIPLLHASLRNADVLLCRSTVRIDRELLGNCPVRFVATATSGVDHVDESWLNKRNIFFASAAGSNALSVAEYIFAALHHLSVTKGFALREKSIGIIGVGHVGKRVAHFAEQLGMRVVLNDPPLKDVTGYEKYRSLDEALDADIVTLHIPYTNSGKYPTVTMMNEETFSRMRAGAIFLNTSRGGVVEYDALRKFAKNGEFQAVVLDVFPNEPSIDPSILEFADIATPHIAGHSYDGKLLGTQMVYEALCRFLGKFPTWKYVDCLPELYMKIPEFGEEIHMDIIINRFIKEAYDIISDDSSFRLISDLQKSEQADYFSKLRREYRQRREFPAHRISARFLDENVIGELKALGFTLE